MQGANGVETPLTNELTQRSDNRPLMSEGEAKRYRRAVARVNYMAQDRCDISSASRVLSQSMASPRMGDEALIKRLIRYLRKYPRSYNFMKYQVKQYNITVMVDSDWAGDVTNRRSTSGGLIMLGEHILQHWSKMQSTIALSSGEAELNASDKGASEGI